mmetsp:Transcript_38915/g.61551  ORF Transcript_38915/g.61551 Transcript_38915/m.61551 type:complete len:221 (-) Transcript_38915:346-1008(-)
MIYFSDLCISTSCRASLSGRRGVEKNTYKCQLRSTSLLILGLALSNRADDSLHLHGLPHQHHKPQSNADCNGCFNPRRHPEINESAITLSTRKSWSSVDVFESNQTSEMLLIVLLWSIGSARKPMPNMTRLAKQNKPHKCFSQNPTGGVSSSRPSARCGGFPIALAKLESRLLETAIMPPTTQARMAALAATIDRFALPPPAAAPSAMIDAEAATATALV